jgi:transcriptional regulator with XRE-family HTH domain
MNVEIAARLAEIRRKNGYSQEELASRLGLSRQAISKWERAESSPDTDNLIALAKLYGTSLDALLAVEPTIEDDVAFESQDRAQTAPKVVATEPVGQSVGQSVGQNVNQNADQSNFSPSPAEQSPSAKSKLRWFPFPLVIVVIYLVSGFVFGFWHPIWIIFLSIPFYYWIVKLIEDDLNRKG